MEKLIVITHPEMLPGEAAIINELFTRGLRRLHLRKPEASEAQLRALLQTLDRQYHNRIALHQHHALAPEFGITGLHLTEDRRRLHTDDELEQLKTNGFTLSTSLHEAEDLENISHAFDYVFLGPLFNSISKSGYVSKLPGNFRLRKYPFPGNVIALGGIHAGNLQSAFEMGFDGVAVLGSIWQNPRDAVAALKALKSITLKSGDSKATGCMIDRLHFISNESPAMSHIDSIRLALEAGCKWVQLRVKNRPEADVLPLAWEATRLCDRYGAKLIINDFPKVALAVGAHGLHLGLSDMPVPEARVLVGNGMIIGGTANTWQDIARRIEEGADYIGLGPYRFTSTKQNLSPILGLEGYTRLLRQMQEAGRHIPIIAIGGITPADIPELRAAGVYGVAVSAALTTATDPRSTFNQIRNTLC